MHSTPEDELQQSDVVLQALLSDTQPDAATEQVSSPPELAHVPLQHWSPVSQAVPFAWHGETTQ
jgi:hypothetical protein